jgi:hypothetical protein
VAVAIDKLITTVRKDGFEGTVLSSTMLLRAIRSSVAAHIKILASDPGAARQPLLARDAVVARQGLYRRASAFGQPHDYNHAAEAELRHHSRGLTAVMARRRERRSMNAVPSVPY